MCPQPAWQQAPLRERQKSLPPFPLPQKEKNVNCGVMSKCVNSNLAGDLSHRNFGSGGSKRKRRLALPVFREDTHTCTAFSCQIPCVIIVHLSLNSFPPGIQLISVSLNILHHRARTARIACRAHGPELSAHTLHTMDSFTDRLLVFERFVPHSSSVVMAMASSLLSNISVVISVCTFV